MKLEKDGSNGGIEENMDPPSFTRNLCKKKLEIPMQDDLEEIHKLMEEKANQIEQRLEKYEESKHGEESKS